MSEFRKRAVLLTVAFAVLCGPTLDAQMVLKMDLPEICSRADKIFRGTVLSATSGTVQVGGGELPTMTYRFKVDEAFQGTYVTKGDNWIAEITMLGKVKPVNADGARSVSPLPDLPELKVGGEYVLMTTRPSSAGLSTPIGLGQGCYTISRSNKVEIATDGLGNTLTYEQLAGQIRAALTQ